MTVLLIKFYEIEYMNSVGVIEIELCLLCHVGGWGGWARVLCKRAGQYFI